MEFSAIQKLVNMTLKYLIIINECESNQKVFDICEDKCDCPIDSIILKKLQKFNHNRHTCWTKITKAEYDIIQDEISEYLKEENQTKAYGNIWFDFLMWQVD